MTTSTFASDGWYAIGGSDELAPGAVMPATILDRELVVWRDSGGGVHAWDNRCTHRGMRLSFGFVDGDTLACRYHGWRYGEGGRCTHIPAHPDLEPPDTFCVKSYSATERCGVIWASTTSEPGSDAGLAELAVVEANAIFIRSLALDAAPARVAALAGKALFQPFAIRDGGDVEYASHEPVAGVVAVDAAFETGHETIIAALQPVSADQTQVHLLVATDVSGDDVSALRRHYAAWSRRWRWFVENEDAETTSWRPIMA